MPSCKFLITILTVPWIMRVTFCTGKNSSPIIDVFHYSWNATRVTITLAFRLLTYIYLTFFPRRVRNFNMPLFGENVTFCTFIRSITSTLDLIMHSNLVPSIFTNNSDDAAFTFSFHHALEALGVPPHLGPVSIQMAAHPPYFIF